MSDYFKSAFGYLNGNGTTNEYVGQLVEINNVKLRVNRLIAEGGWALVFAVEDIATGKEYALKKLIAVDDEANKTVIQEVDTLKRLSGHSNIIQYMCAQCVERDDKKSWEYLLVTELCPGGNLADLLRTRTTPPSLPQICKIAYQATRAVHHMHSQQPQPIVHWDIKLENFLLSDDGTIKLCDFGSASTQQILPDPSWSAQKRSALEDQMSRYTTPMYRSPEMMDTWNNEPIGPPADCWALGCILYSLVTLKHPFSEGNKLAIVNAKYSPLPPNPPLSCLHDLIRGCLEVSPIKRITTSVLLERLASISESNNFDPREPAKIEPSPPRPQPPKSANIPQNPTPPPPKPAPPKLFPPATQPAIPTRPAPHYPAKAPQSQTGSGLFSSLRGGAGSILKNLKDTSSKVMHTVQQSMARNELDASYLTSRILVMPYPADGIESAYRTNHVEDVRAYIQSRHPAPAKIQLYNLSRGRPNVTRLPGKHIDCNFAYATPDANAPLLSALYQICQDIYRYLDADFNHIVVLYCTDGCRASATVACALLLYCGVLATPAEAVNLFTTRRCQPPILQPSELKTINYMSALHSGVHPHTRPLALRSILLQPIPLFTRARDGCRPYVEIYSNGALVYSTKRSEYEEMKLFDMMEGKACLILGDATVRGDVTIIVFHARQQLGRVIGIKIAGLYFHTGYVPVNASTLDFERKDLDDAPEFGGQFRIILNVMICEENSKASRIPAPWEVAASREQKLNPDPLFSSTLEMEETLENFRTTGQPKKVPSRPPPPSSPARHAIVTSISTPAEERVAPEGEPLYVEDEEKGKEEKGEEEKVDEREIEDKGGDNFEEADLLNLGMSSEFNINAIGSNPPPGLDIFSGSQHDGDILGGFSSFPPTEADHILKKNNLLLGNESTNDLLFGQDKIQKSSPDDFLFDPLGTGTNDLMGSWGGTKGSILKTPSEDMPRNSSVPNFSAQNKDPFATLAGSLGAGLNSSWNGTPHDSNTPQSSSPAAVGTPIHSSPRMHIKSNSSNEGSESVSSNRPAKSGDAFEDLLGSQGYNFFSSRKADKDSPKTINQMRKVEQAKTMDPERLKVNEWTEGKKGNLRALLCSLHTVLWPEADRWQRYEMHQLVSPADVKKAYRKACLAVHPDKQTGTANENIAKLIFMELNNAWSAFESDASQQNLFS
ncbi:cyclin-G-associated kinase [Fopius arisanus]|uniref:non-specific serine/threonine protein kinase n=2 Tax=Fopius arisanus TaxID=64838 RepID=A0A0C9QP38_9HYME|nr:PREDICTED: cyclin-G-associated kinase [Fopius arisanus]